MSWWGGRNVQRRGANTECLHCHVHSSHHITSLAARATKDTNLPSPSIVAPPASTHKTLAHALSRAAAQGAIDMSTAEPLGAALQKFSIAMDKVGTARLMQDSEIVAKFVQPLSTTLNSRIKLSTDARRKANTTRLYLDSCKNVLKSARPEKQEAARLEAEQAEDQFVSAVEEATTLMKNVLDNVSFKDGGPGALALFLLVANQLHLQPEPIKNLTDFVSAQAAFHKQAHDVLSDALSEMESIQHHVESEYRQSRG